MQRTCILLIFGFILAQNISAQTYQFRTLSTIDGLSQNDVNDIYQDSQGYIWLATYDGLNRYDGYEFVTYRNSLAKKKSLRSNLTHNVVEDDKGNLWIATADEGVSIFNKSTEQFTNLLDIENLKNAFWNNGIGEILCYPNGSIWIESYDLLNHLQYDSDGKYHVIKYSTNTDTTLNSISSYSIQQLFKPSDTSIWVVGHGGINIINLNDKYQQKGNIKTINHNTSFFEFIIPSQDDYIVGSSDGTFLMKLLNGTDIVQFIKFTDIVPTTLSLDFDNNLWMGTLNGIYYFKLDSTNKIPFILTNHFTRENSNLSSDIIRCSLIDRTGILWFGTNGGGVNILNIKKNKFRQITEIKDVEDRIYKNKYRAIHQDINGNLWLGTENKGIFCLPAQFKKNYNASYFRLQPNKFSRWHSTYCFVDIHTPRGNFIWAGCSFDTVLVELDYKCNKYNATIRNINRVGAQCFQLYQDKDSIIWIATYNEGLYRYNPYSEPENFENFTAKNSNLPSDIVRSFLDDKQGRLWIGTSHGLCLLTPSNRSEKEPEFIVYHTEANNPKSISHNYILPIVQTQNGDIWIGTMGGGLNKFIEAKDEIPEGFEHYSASDGLPNNNIKSIIEDNTGNLWISSNKGITRFNPSSLTMVNYDITDGLQDNEFTDMNGYKLADGEILFGGVNGFNAFYPHEVVQDSTIPEIALTKLQIHSVDITVNEEINGRMILPVNLNDLQTLHLKHSENYLTIHFSALHYASPSKNQYQYMLEKIDNDWIKTDANSRFAKYTNLEPGKYTFKVRVSNGDNIWNETPRELPIIIKPPFWETLLFRITLIVVISSILILAYKQHVRKISLELKQSLEHERILTIAKKKVEESDNLKSSIIANLSHEIRTPVNGISGFSELLSNDKLAPDRRMKYSKIVKQKCDDLIKLLDSILNISAAHSGNMKVDEQDRPLGTSIIEASIGAKDKITASGKPIEVKLSNDNDDLKQVVKTDHYKVLSILNSLLDNAIKFTDKGEITIGCMVEDDMIKYSVSDTGIGIAKEHKNIIFDEFRQTSIGLTRKYDGLGLGLSLCRSYLIILNGHIWFDSAEGQGSTFYFTVPYQKGS